MMEPQQTQQQTEGMVLLSYRVEQLEKSMQGMRGDVQSAVGQLGGGLTALQTQLTTWQGNSVRPRDFDELTRRVDSIANAETQRGWMLAGALLTSIIAAIFTVIGWMAPHISTH